MPDRSFAPSIIVGALLLLIASLAVIVWRAPGFFETPPTTIVPATSQSPTPPATPTLADEIPSGSQDLFPYKWRTGKFLRFSIVEQGKFAPKTTCSDDQILIPICNELDGCPKEPVVFCVDVEQEGAAGHRYRTYTFNPLSKDTQSVESYFVLQTVEVGNCSVYDDPDVEALCDAEQQLFQPYTWFEAWWRNPQSVPTCVDSVFGTCQS